MTSAEMTEPTAGAPATTEPVDIAFPSGTGGDAALCRGWFLPAAGPGVGAGGGVVDEKGDDDDEGRDRQSEGGQRGLHEYDSSRIAGPQ